jgi:hypothetical protein
MKKINYIAFFCITALVMIACSKENNYKYTNVNTAFVDTTQFARSIVIQQNATCSITPVFMQGVDPSKLTYEWRLTKIESTPGITGKYTDTVLSTSQNLSSKIYFGPGAYYLRLHVFDPSNGNVAQIINTPFTVSSFALPGLMLLHGDPTSCDVSILVNNQVNTTLPQGVDSIQRNIFSLVNGKKIEGEARSLSFINHGSNGGDSRVYALTYPNGGYRTDFGNLKITDSYNNLFTQAPSRSNFTAYCSNGTDEILIDSTNLYYQSQAQQPVGYLPFNIKSYFNSPPSTTVTASSFITMDIDNSSAVGSGYVGVYFDPNIKRFTYAKNDNMIYNFGSTTPPAGNFSLYNPGAMMWYAEDGYPDPTVSSPYFSKRWYCVMSGYNLTNPITPKPLTRRVYICEFGRLPHPSYPGDNTKSMDPTDYRRGVAVDTISLAADMDNAKYFAFGNKGPVMYYATDTKIYLSNDYKTSALYNDISANYAGSVITCMKVFKVKGHPSDGQLFYVALYDASSNTSTLLQYTINPINGVATGSPKAYNGIAGKIGAMNYKPF